MRTYGAELLHKVNVPHVLERGLALFPDRTALVAADGEWTWRALDTLSDSYAANLHARGLAPGDRVASFLPNSGTLFIHYLGLLKSGLVAVPLNYRYTAPEIDHALKLSGARALVYDGTRHADVAGSTEAAQLALLFHRDGDGIGPHSDRVETLMRLAMHNFAAPPSDAPAVIFFTSGSTGAAKGVTHTHETLGWILASSRITHQHSPDDRHMCGSSASHVGGFTTSLSCLSQGGTVVLARAGYVDEMLDMIRRHHPSILAMVPSAHFALERSAHLRAGDFASFRLIISAGDTVPETLQTEFMEKTGRPIAQLYGMTESPAVLMNHSGGLMRRNSIGRTCAGYACELRDDDGNPVAPGMEGRLFFRFPGSMAYYWNDPAATASVYDADGWIDTGDLMRADEEGYYYFCARRKQIIVHDGSNIFPQEVEDALLAHDAVAMAGVVGLADVVHGETVCAYVALSAGAEVTVDALIAFARERVGYKAPEIVHIVDDVPLNATGKVDRERLKRLAAEDRDAMHH